MILQAVIACGIAAAGALRPPSAHRRQLTALSAEWRDAQRQLMDGGAAIELSGDALLAEAQALPFIEANIAIRQPRCVAGVALKNAGRSIADVGAKLRHKGGLELAA
eukprot:CAMPEP_0119277520 /NCGR_PEP_ID=MMETSP1329-20130426/17308_1 /TAXON_ID=114041 /ORGANISM="Genus nov. species nov., Strain RCC1024" /LENGTH=106 /DNA_ID=CAMNT_0007277993 /DNA_START=26 /DNA_END=342 /DNA_ORIENTATION=+